MGLGTMSCAFKESKKLFSFELSDRHRNAKTGEMQQAASTDSDDSEDNSDEDMEREVVTVEPGAADASDTDEGSTSDEEGPLVGRWCLSRHLNVFLSMMRCLLI